MTLQDTQYSRSLKLLMATSSAQPVSTDQYGYNTSFGWMDYDFPYSKVNMKLAEEL